MKRQRGCFFMKHGVWHILRKKGDCLEKELIQGTMPASCTRGKPKMTWIDNIKSWTGLSLTELIRNVEDRHQWRLEKDCWPTLVVMTAKGRQALNSVGYTNVKMAEWIELVLV